MNPDPVWSTVNWVHLSNGEALSVQRLGVRYRLHPLVVEDLAYREDRFDDASYHALFSHAKKDGVTDSARAESGAPTLMQLVPS